uniref:Uncharacterized protein n=1 Tax=Megaselia scalaris TaxID=36166 RepID=T1GR54_MEGSC
MKNRQPLTLKKFMVFYNIYQILACMLMLKFINDTKVRFWGPFCFSSHPDFLDPADEHFLKTFTYWLKVSEMIETIVFLLRKKTSQYHLSSDSL